MAVRGLSHRAVLLDALGTLVELLPPAPRLRAELARRFGLQVSEAQADQAMAAEIVYYRAHLNEGRDERGLDDLRRRCAQVVGGELAAATGEPLPSAEDLVPALLASLSFRAFPDVVPALAAVKELGLRTVVVSNWDASLPGVLERARLTPWIDHVLTSAQVDARKPDPAIFERALGLAGSAAAEAIHVGDSIDEDIAGARAAGVEAVLLIRTGGEPPDGVPSIGSLRELPGLLGSRAGAQQ